MLVSTSRLRQPAAQSVYPPSAGGGRRHVIPKNLAYRRLQLEQPLNSKSRQRRLGVLDIAHWRINLSAFAGMFRKLARSEAGLANARAIKISISPS